MKAKIEIKTEVSYNEICLSGGLKLHDLLTIIESKTHECMHDISRQRQSEQPDLEYIDAPLYYILNIIESLR